jgi:hypothetical protein
MTPASIAKAMQIQRICCAWGRSIARGFARVILDRVRGNLDPAPGSSDFGSELDADAEINFFLFLFTHYMFKVKIELKGAS